MNIDDRIVWERSFSNESGQLAQGVRDIKGTNTIFFVPKSKVPRNQRVTYRKIICDYKPTKAQKERTRFTVGGNFLDFTGNLSAPTASFATAKVKQSCTHRTCPAHLGA